MNYKQNEDHIDLDELDSRLFDCADVLRGSVDSGRYKDFVLPLVFYAAVNGWYERELESMVKEKENKSYEELPENKKQFFVKQASRDFGINIPENQSWNELTEEENNLCVKIDNYLSEFEDANGERYTDIFNNNFKSIESFKNEDGTRMLKDLISKIDAIDFSEIPPDMMGEAYMNLVKRFSESDAGEYFTPPRIVDLMVRLIEPFEEGSKFHDPTAGSAGMLVEAAQHLREQYKGRYEDDKEETKQEKLRDFIDREFEFSGQEKNPTIAGIAKMNLALHGLQGDIRRGDSLTNPQFEHNNQLDTFDYILANFPFSERGWKTETAKRQERYGDMDWAENGKLPHGNYGDFAFIMHMTSQLNDDGELATVIPHGILFRNGDQKYREHMIQQDMVEAVVGLPEDLFESTGIPSAILVLNKDKPEEREGEVMFFNANHEDRFFYDTGSSRTKLLEDGISELKSMFNSWEDEERVCRVVEADEIEENEYNMNIALYVDTTEPQEDISVEDTLDSIHDLETQYTELNQQLQQYMHQLDYTTGDNNE